MTYVINFTLCELSADATFQFITEMNNLVFSHGRIRD